MDRPPAARCRRWIPTKVTAFREEMAVHGRFGLPCPTCGTTIQRIVYAENETNYCPRCQTGGKVLASDWPRRRPAPGRDGQNDEANVSSFAIGTSPCSSLMFVAGSRFRATKPLADEARRRAAGGAGERLRVG